MPRLFILACLALLVSGCQRSVPADDATAERREPNRLMPRQPEQRERAPTIGEGRIKCTKPVPSVPCEP